MRDHRDKNNPPKKRSLLDGGITFFTVVAAVAHGTIGFFIIKGWEYVWNWWVKIRKKRKPPIPRFLDKKD
jgi:hypothetical protein